MRVSFDNCLICDVLKTTFEEKNFFSLMVYQDGKLYRVSIPKESVNTFKQAIGQSFSFEASISFFDGKAKFKLVQD